MGDYLGDWACKTYDFCGVGDCLRNWAYGAICGVWRMVKFLWLSGRLFWRLSLCGFEASML